MLTRFMGTDGERHNVKRHGRKAGVGIGNNADIDKATPTQKHYMLGRLDRQLHGTRQRRILIALSASAMRKRIKAAIGL